MVKIDKNTHLLEGLSQFIGEGFNPWKQGAKGWNGIGPSLKKINLFVCVCVLGAFRSQLIRIAFRIMSTICDIISYQKGYKYFISLLRNILACVVQQNYYLAAKRSEPHILLSLFDRSCAALSPNKRTTWQREITIHYLWNPMKILTSKRSWLQGRAIVCESMFPFVHNYANINDKKPLLQGVT